MKEEWKKFEEEEEKGKNLKNVKKLTDFSKDFKIILNPDPRYFENGFGDELKFEVDFNWRKEIWETILLKMGDKELVPKEYNGKSMTMEIKKADTITIFPALKGKPFRDIQLCFDKLWIYQDGIKIYDLKFSSDIKEGEKTCWFDWPIKIQTLPDSSELDGKL